MAKDTVKDYVERMTDANRRQVIVDYEEYSVHGMIGECVLRGEARSLANSLGVLNDSNITSWMNMLHRAVCQYFTFRYFSLETATLQLVNSHDVADLDGEALAWREIRRLNGGIGL